MANYTVFADNDKLQNDGTTSITATSTVIDGGSAYHISAGDIAATLPMTARVTPGFAYTVFASQVIRTRDVIGALTSAAVTLTSVATNGGLARYTLNSHVLVVGDVISVTGATAMNTTHRVTAVALNTFDTDVTFVTSGTAGVYAILDSTSNFGIMTAEKWIMMRVTDEIAGKANTTLRSGGNAGYADRRSIHQVESVWTNRVATAIAADTWGIYSGTFSTTPTNADDFATMGADSALPTLAIPGQLVYKEPQPNPVSGNYPAKNG